MVDAIEGRRGWGRPSERAEHENFHNHNETALFQKRKSIRQDYLPTAVPLALLLLSYNRVHGLGVIKDSSRFLNFLVTTTCRGLVYDRYFWCPAFLFRPTAPCNTTKAFPETQNHFICRRTTAATLSLSLSPYLSTTAPLSASTQNQAP